jgi:hypothetical protein
MCLWLRGTQIRNKEAMAHVVREGAGPLAGRASSGTCLSRKPVRAAVHSRGSYRGVHSSSVDAVLMRPEHDSIR